MWETRIYKYILYTIFTGQQWAAAKETHFKRDIIVSCLFLPVSSVVLGDDHRRGSQRQHGPVSARAVLCFDTTTSGDTSYPGVLWGFESEAVTHSWYQWWSARAQLCSGENSTMQFQLSKCKSLKKLTWLVFFCFFSTGPAVKQTPILKYDRWRERSGPGSSSSSSSGEYFSTLSWSISSLIGSLVVLLRA